MRKTARRKNHLKNKLVFGFFGFSALLVIAGAIAYRVLFSDTGFAFSATSYDLTRENISVVSEIEVANLDATKPIQINSLSVVFYDKKGKRITKYTLPITLKVDVAGKFGEEELSKVLALGLLQDHDLKIAAETVNLTLEKIIGFNVDRYILINDADDVEGSIDSLIFQGKTLELKNIRHIISAVRTNMSIKEFYDLVTFSGSLPQDRIGQQLVNRYEMSAVSDYFDVQLADLTFDSTLALEKKNVAVLNGSGVAGVASFGSRFIENLGGHVVSTNNANRTHDTSIMIVDDPESETVKQLNKFFKVKEIITKQNLAKSTPDLNEPVVDRADITIIFGFDFAKKMF